VERALRLYAQVRDGRSEQCTAAIDALVRRAADVDAMDPMAVAVYTMAIYLSGHRVRTWQAALTRGVVRSQIRQPPGHGSWPVVVEGTGPLQTTAWRLLTLQFYYRYCKLQLASDG
jgi:hypothetical protein